MGMEAEDGGRARRRLGRAVLAAGGRWRRCCYENMRGPCLKTLQGASYINRPFMALSCSKTGPFTSAWLRHGGVTRLKGLFVRGAWGEAARLGELGRPSSSSGAAEPHQSLPRQPARSPRCQHPPASVPLPLQLPMGPEQSPLSPHQDLSNHLHPLTGMLRDKSCCGPQAPRPEAEQGMGLSAEPRQGAVLGAFFAAPTHPFHTISTSRA